MAITTGLFPEGRALVTGANGKVGQLLGEALSPVELVCLEEAAPHTASTLLHLAASTTEIIDANVLYLRQALERARDLGVRNVVFFSTMSVYGEQNKEGVTEEEPLRSPGLYGLSKLLGEAYLETSGLNVLVLRLPAVLTLDSETYIARLLQQLRQNDDIALYNHDRNFNSFLDVRDLAHFLCQCSLQRPFDVINLASRCEQSLYAVVTHLKDVIGSSSKITPMGAKGRYYNVDIGKAVREYGFTPSDYKESLTRWWQLHER